MIIRIHTCVYICAKVYKFVDVCIRVGPVSLRRFLLGEIPQGLLTHLTLIKAMELTRSIYSFANSTTTLQNF